jgi:hypothetical protein
MPMSPSLLWRITFSMSASISVTNENEEFFRIYLYVLRVLLRVCMHTLIMVCKDKEN